MPVKIRLTRQGRKRKPIYHIVVADSRAPRDGKYIERLGIYNPGTNPATIDLNFDKALDWLQKGAQPTDTCRTILSYRGVMIKKHLLEGVKKGAFSEEEANIRFEKWLQDKEAKIQSRADSIQQAREAEIKKRLEAESKIKEAMAQKIAKRKAAETEAEDAARKEAAEAVNEEAPVADVAPAKEQETEEKKEEVKADAPAEEEKKEEKVETPKEEVKAEVPAAEDKSEDNSASEDTKPDAESAEK